MDRRDFIKIGSVLTAGSTVLTSCGKTLRQSASLTIPDNQRVIGEERRVKSVCRGCGGGCGVEVRWVDGRAIKLEGLAGHPVNNGRLCARGQAELQLLYNPDRIQKPRLGKQEVSWDRALEVLVEKLKSTDPRGVALLTPPLRGLRRKLADEFVAALGAPPRVEMEPLGCAAVREANRRCTGYYALPAVDYFHSNYVLSFGAPLLEAGPSPVLAQRGLGHMRQGRPGTRGKLVQVESRYSLTAAYADEWVYAHPGTEGALALAIGHALGRASDWTPARAAEVTGVPEQRIERLASEFAKHKPAVAVIGGAAAGYANSLAAAEAVAALNELSGSYGVEGGVRFDPPEEGAVGSLESVARATVILVAGCNPDYEFPGLLPSGAWVASFASFPDETAERAQLVLPDHTALEAWQDSIPEALGYLARSVARPAVLPMYETRDAADVLLEVLGKLGKKQPAENWPKMIETSFASEEDFSTAIEQGGLWAEAPGKFTFATASKKFEFGKEPWSPPQFGPGGDLWLQPYAGVALGKGQASNVPWLQELPDPLSQTVWGTAVELNPKTAAKLGVAEGDRVTVQSARGQLTGRAVISPGCPPNVVAVAAGQGHRSFGRYAAGRGGNVYALVDATQWASAKVSVRKIWFLESRW